LRLLKIQPAVTVIEMVLKDAMTATLSMVTAAAPRAVSKEAGPAQVDQ